jgi:hypothetical protein
LESNRYLVFEKKIKFLGTSELTACSYYAKKVKSQKKIVNFLFNLPGQLGDKPKRRYNKKIQGYEEISTPEIVTEYNYTHNYVDSLKHILSKV